MTHDPFDDYLRGNSPISQAYHDLPAEEPGAALDAAILAAARREVQAQPQAIGTATRRRRWAIPQSLAATVLVGIGAALMLRQMGDEPLRVPEQPAPAMSAPARPAEAEVRLRNEEAEVRLRKEESAVKARAPAPAAVEQAVANTAQPRAKAAEKRQAVAEPQPFPGAVAPAPYREADLAKDAKPAAAAEAVRPPQPLEATGSMVPAAPPATAAPKPAAPAVSGKALADSPAPLLEERAQSSDKTAAPAKNDVGGNQDRLERGRVTAPTESKQKKLEAAPQLAAGDWIAKIRRLRDLGQRDEMQRELKEFRLRYPDYPLPPDLRGE